LNQTCRHNATNLTHPEPSIIIIFEIISRLELKLTP